MDDPLDLTGFLPRPCTVLTEPQLAGFNITDPGESNTTGAIAENVGPWCTWLTSDEISDAIAVGFLVNNTRGIAAVYGNRDRYEYFIPVMVDGYPAVFAEQVDLRDGGDCNIFVGVSDTTTFRAEESGKLDSEGACERAKQVAAAALATMRKGG